MKSEVEIKIQNLHNKVRGLLNAGMTEEEIIANLKKDNIDPAYVKLLIQNIKSDNRDKVDFWKLMLMGLFFIIGGSLLNYFSYRIAIRSNSYFYYLYWGFIVAGIIFIIKAFAIYRKDLFKH